MRQGLTQAIRSAGQTGVGDASFGCQIVHRGRAGVVGAEQRAIQRAGRLDHLPALCQFPLSLLFLKQYPQHPDRARLGDLPLASW